MDHLRADLAELLLEAAEVDAASLDGPKKQLGCALQDSWQRADGSCNGFELAGGDFAEALGSAPRNRPGSFRLRYRLGALIAGLFEHENQPPPGPARSGNPAKTMSGNGPSL